MPVRLCRGGPRSGRSTAGSGRTRGRQTGLPELELRVTPEEEMAGEL